jgi:hypothetical protein
VPMMPGVLVRDIRDALVDAFDHNELQQMLRTEMDLKLGAIVGPGPLGTVAFNLVEWAERVGQDRELLRAAYRSRPRNDALRAIYQKYGFAPAATLRRPGQAVEPAQPATDPGLEKAVKPYLPDFDVALWREQLAALEGRVCRVEVHGPIATMGTGFLVGPEALLTNYHVLEPLYTGAAPASAVRFRFDYKVLSNGMVSDGVVVSLAPEWRIAHSPYSQGEAHGSPDDPPPAAGELDYALVRLGRPLGQEPYYPGACEGRPRGWVRVPESEPDLSGRCLFILQHPRREPLKLALDTDAAPRLIHGGLRLRYDTNTDEGSSGSPCFNARWTLVALHHYGDPAIGQATYNQGIPIHRIREQVRAALDGMPDPFGGDPP